MAKPNRLLVVVLLSLLPSAKTVSEPELDATISALRSRGYHLFGNAITTSDVRLELLLSNASYTLFAPTDATLFSLDMASSATAYVRALRYHLALGHLPLPSLRSLPDGTALRTLIPYCNIFISHRRSLDSDFVTVDGVDIVLPGLFYGQEVAVHGLAGILTVHHRCFPARTIPPASRSPDSRFPPSVAPDFRLPPSRSAETPADSHHLPSIAPDSRLPPSRSAETPSDSHHPPARSHHPPSIAPDFRLPPSKSAETPSDAHHPPSIAPDSTHYPFESADPPDIWTPVGSPTVDLSPMAPKPQAPSPGSMSLAAVPYQAPVQSGMRVEFPSGISPAVDMGRAAPIPSEIVFPGGKQGEDSSGISPAAGAPVVTLKFSYNVGACSKPEMAGCTESGGFGHEKGQCGSERPRQLVRDDAL